MRPKIVTTSWDDGAVQDLRVAELLSKHGVRATFYVSVAALDGVTAMTHAQLRQLSSSSMEIGAHGFAHHILPKLPRPELSHSVQTCKQVLEWVMGEPVRMFAYPKGRYSSQVIAELRQAGYQGARTNRMFSNTLKFDPFEMPTTVQAFPHSRTAYVKNTLRSGKVARFFDYARRYRSCRSWLELGKKTFDQVMQDGGIWHLFGHSWEIDRLNLWAELETLAEYVGGRPGVIYAGNGDTLKLLQSQNVDLVLRAQAS